MTADEIRKRYKDSDRDNSEMYLAEIAAQLAKLNEWLRTPQATKDAIEAQHRGR